MIDDEGFESLGMRSLAARLNVAPNSLYSYVADKEDLNRAIFRKVLDNLKIPEPGEGPWTVQAAELCLACRRSLLEHPNVVSAPGFRVTFPFSYNPLLVPMGAILHAAGFKDEHLVETLFSTFYFTVGFVTLEVARARHGIGTKTDDDVIEEAGEFFDDGYQDRAHKLLPLVRGLDLDKVFENTLHAILKGLDEALQDGSKPTP
jgi:AcrR family transcriptional regulator